METVTAVMTWSVWGLCDFTGHSFSFLFLFFFLHTQVLSMTSKLGYVYHSSCQDKKEKSSHMVHGPGRETVEKWGDTAPHPLLLLYNVAGFGRANAVRMYSCGQEVRPTLKPNVSAVVLRKHMKRGTLCRVVHEARPLKAASVVQPEGLLQENLPDLQTSASTAPSAGVCSGPDLRFLT